MEEPDEAQVSVDTWLQSIKTELENVPPFLNWSIWRVPSKLRTQNEDAYSPHIISIGPLHHGTQNVLAMEAHKCHYTLHLMKRWWKADDALAACGRVILGLEKQVRACYGEAIKYSERELAKMILLDGCFLIELFLRKSRDEFRSPDDSIFTSSWMLSTLQRDLALLENQIPFFVLERLFQLLDPSLFGGFNTTLPEIAIEFFQRTDLINAERIRNNGSQISHLLHLIHYCSVPSPERVYSNGESASPNGESASPNGESEPQFIHCAKSLSDAGIEFKMDSGTATFQPVFENGVFKFSPSSIHDSTTSPQFIHCAKSLSDAGIEFKMDYDTATFQPVFENGVFKFSPLCIHDSTTSLFRNLIAYEQRLKDGDRRITFYFLLMDRLVDTVRDIELLVDKQIIKNNLGSWEELSDFFNNICKHVVLEDSHFAGLCQEVNNYYNKKWHRYIADLKRKHFMNPWTIISLFAGFVLLSLTSLQTIYSLLSYYQH